MKKILGSLVLLSLTLFAKSVYEWKVDLHDKELYTHQSTVLSMQCSFSKEGKNDDVEFTPPKDIPFDFKLLSEKRSFTGEEQTMRYTYLVFAQKAGEYTLKLQPKMLFTTQSAIDDVIVGRDNVNDLEVEKETAQIEAIRLKVNETSSALTGSLDLAAKLDVKEVSAFEPVHLEISIQGVGNLHELQPLHFEIEGVEVFSDAPEKNFVLSDEGYKGKWVQHFAFVSKKDFVIPPVSIRYFDLREKQLKLLKTEAFSLSIKADGIKREELIDRVDIPSEKIDFSVYLGYIYYVLSFVAGFLVAKIVRVPKRTVKREKGEKIKKARSEKELLEVLMRSQKTLFSSEIQELETAVYRGVKVELSTLKKRALSRL